MEAQSNSSSSLPRNPRPVRLKLVTTHPDSIFDSPKNRKKARAKEEQYLEEHIEKTKVSCDSVCFLIPCLCCCFHPPYLFFIHLSPCYPPYFCHTPGTWNILDQQREQVLWTIIQHYFLLLTCVPDIHITLCVPSKLHKLFRSVQTKGLTISVPLPHRYHEPAAGCTAHCLHWKDICKSLVRCFHLLLKVTPLQPRSQLVGITFTISFCFCVYNGKR